MAEKSHSLRKLFEKLTDFIKSVSRAAQGSPIWDSLMFHIPHCEVKNYAKVLARLAHPCLLLLAGTLQTKIKKIVR